MRSFTKPPVAPARRQLLEARAHGLRTAPTVSEAVLWKALSGSKLSVAFRRQVPVGHGFIVDFLAPSLKPSKWTGALMSTGGPRTRGGIRSFEGSGIVSSASARRR